MFILPPKPNIGAALGQGISQGIQNAIPLWQLKKDVQALQKWQQDKANYEMAMSGIPPVTMTGTPMGQVSPMGPMPTAPQMPNFRSPMMNQALAGSMMPMSPFQERSLDIQEKRYDAMTKGRERNYQVQWYDRTGKKQSRLVPEGMYDSFQDMIQKQGGTLTTPESWEDKYKFWTHELQRARGTTSSDTLARVSAKLMGVEVPASEDVEGVKLAMGELKKLRKEKGLPDVPDEELGMTSNPRIELSQPAAQSKPEKGSQAVNYYINSMKPGPGPEKMNLMQSGFKQVPASFWDRMGPDKTLDTLRRLAAGGRIVEENGKYVLYE